MVKDIKYIIKRILIGVGIALLLYYIKFGFILGVSAMQVSSYSMGTNYYGVNNTHTRIDHSITGNPWASYANFSGFVNFNFSLTKLTGNSTSPLVQPRGVSVTTGGNGFICNFGSVSSNNSTFNSQVYSVRCPVTMSSSGLNTITILFQDFQSNDISDYRVTLTSGMSFEIVEKGDVNVNLDTSGTTNAINNQITNDNQNTQDIIDSQEEQTQDIINNQNTNTEKEIESQKVCKLIDKQDIEKDNYQLWTNGQEHANNNDGITGYIKINESTKIKIIESYQVTLGACFYNINKELISCINYQNYENNQEINIPQNSSYIRATIRKAINKPQFKICTNGNQAIVNSQQDINNTLNDDNVDSQQAGDFFSNFQHDSHGLSGIVTSPLRLINSLTTATCNPLEFDLPFVHEHVVLPCMKPIYENYFGVFFSLWQLITTGLISYNILINIYSKIHNLQNPNNDRIEVLNL